MQKALELLISLGLPSAVIAMVLIALVFKRDHAKIGAWAGWAAIGLVGVIGIGQLVEIWRGEVSVDLAPKDVFAFNAAGHPVELEITVKRAGSTLQSAKIDKIPDSSYAARHLTLARGDDGLAVIFEDRPIGQLNRERLIDVGWRPATECDSAEAGDPKFWSTHRVYLGREHNLGKTRYGVLKLNAKRFTGEGKAVVTLSLEGHEAPLPKDVAIANKGLGVQSFADVPEFYIAVREADFTVDPPWAASAFFWTQ